MQRSRAARVVTLLVVAVGVGVVATYAALRAFPALAWTDGAEDDDARIVASITREEQVVLLSLGIEGIAERSATGRFLGLDVPGTSRSSFVQYGFQAKLGVEGRDVRIERTGEDELVISVPEFVFIGHDEETFRTVVEDNGVLSFVTPEIDTVEMINAILDADAQDEYVEANTEVLQDQARAFYSAIVRSIDPTTTVRFEFR